MADILAECYFLDVGQGASQVILLQSGDALVIDAGNTSGGDVTLAVLKEYLLPPNRIRALVVTHNHDDHASGADQVLQEFAERIDCIYFVQDRPAPELRIYKLIQDLRRRKRYEGGIERLEVDESTGTKRLYPVSQQRPKGYTPVANIYLNLLAPSFSDDLSSDEKHADNKPNRIAGILMIECGTARIMFSSDAPIEAWKSLRERANKQITCDVLSGPHHGGKLSKERSHLADDHTWIYANAVKPAHVIFSVGTDNKYEHPYLEAVAAARKANAIVICTQITERCSFALEALRPGVITLQQPCLSSPTNEVNSAGRSQNVACASTVLCEVALNKVEVLRVDEHQNAITNRLPSAGWTPLCRR
jgi:beta-lactamase superfamily II metal-dependent hydrolase